MSQTSQNINEWETQKTNKLFPIKLHKIHQTKHANRPEEGGCNGGGSCFRKTDENSLWAPEVISLCAGSTSFESQPLFLLGFLRAVGGLSYGVVWFLRKGRFLNLPPVPNPPTSWGFCSGAVAMRERREKQRPRKSRRRSFKFSGGSERKLGF